MFREKGIYAPQNLRGSGCVQIRGEDKTQARQSFKVVKLIFSGRDGLKLLLLQVLKLVRSDFVGEGLHGEKEAKHEPALLCDGLLGFLYLVPALENQALPGTVENIEVVGNHGVCWAWKW
jgi:hypothetical protein